MGLAGGGKDKANGRDPRGRKPGQRRRDALEKRRDRREAVQMKLREKLTSEEIAERLNAKYYRTEEEEARAIAKGKKPAHLSPAQIRVELKIAEEEFKEDTTDDLLQIRLQLLREFEDLEAYAWGRHYASIGEHKIVVETDGEKASTRTTTEELVGDRGWVELAAKCKEFRLRLTGAEPPRKIAPTNPQGTKPFEFEQPEEFKRLAALAIDLLPDLKDLLK
jgi:hypothetical protein